MRAVLFAMGAVAYRVPAASARALFELLHAGGFAPKGIKRCKKSGDITFSLLPREARRFDAHAAAFGVVPTARVPHGAVRVLSALRARPGLIVGTLLALLLLALSPLFVWEVEIYGNERIPCEEFTRELREAGLYRGAFLPRLDREGVATALRQRDPRVAYATLNVSGTVARVQIREGEKEPDNAPRLPANLVAKRDGVITLPLVYEGECLVREGDVVREGQILASGVRDTQNHGYRVTRAAGEVMARTTYTYTVRVPFVGEEKAYVGQKRYEVTLFFFDNARKVFKSTGKSTMECDIIEKIQWFTLPSGKRLPFGIAVVAHLPFARVDVTYTPREAREIAEAQLASLLAAECEGRTLLSRTVELSVEPSAVTLYCTLVCEENIAAVSEFELTPK